VRHSLTFFLTSTRHSNSRHEIQIFFPFLLQTPNCKLRSRASHTQTASAKLHAAHATQPHTGAAQRRLFGEASLQRGVTVRTTHRWEDWRTYRNVSQLAYTDCERGAARSSRHPTAHRCGATPTLRKGQPTERRNSTDHTQVGRPENIQRCFSTRIHRLRAQSCTQLTPANRTQVRRNAISPERPAYREA
jgi:hypothetical protein